MQDRGAWQSLLSNRVPAVICCQLSEVYFHADQAAHSQDTARTHESFAAQSSWPHPFGSFEEQDLQRDSSGNSRQALTDATNGSALGDARDWQPPRQELGRFVPPGLVRYGRHKFPCGFQQDTDMQISPLHTTLQYTEAERQGICHPGKLCEAQGFNVSMCRVHNGGLLELSVELSVHLPCWGPKHPMTLRPLGSN